MDIDRIRQQIPVCQRIIYINSGWSGPSPVPVVEAIKARLDYEMEQGPTTPEVRDSGREIQDQARLAVANLLNATPEEILLTKNTTDGINLVINGLTWSQGDEIITCSLEHSSVLVPSYFQQWRHGAVVKVVSLASDEGADAILAKIESAITNRTRLVFLSHIQYSTGLRMPVEEIRRMTKDRGILLLLDGAQTAGHISLDMRELDCDFYAIPGQKWLLGSEGVGALFIRQDMISQVQPVHVSGRAVQPHHGDEDMEPETASIDKFRGSSSSTALQAGMLEAIRFVQAAGMQDIEERDLDLASQLKQALGETPGVHVLSPLERRGSSGLVSFAIDGIEPADAVTRLWEQHQIVCRQVGFPAGIRVALHFFNTEDEVGQVVEAVRRMV